MVDYKQALELADSLFSFDYLGDSMLAVRKELNNEALQDELVDALIAAMASESGNGGEDTTALYTEAAKARVQQYVKSAKSSSGTGCGK